MFMVALAVFTLGSFLCGLSPDLAGGGGEWLLILFRVLQGIGGGMLFPLATSIAFGAFPPAERAASSAVIARPGAAGTNLRPHRRRPDRRQQAGWPGIFFVNMPIGIVALLLIARV